MGYLAAEWDFGAIDAIERRSATCSATAGSCCIPLPGHTPGSIGALVQLERSGTFLLAADTVSAARHARPGHRAAQHPGTPTRW